MSKIKRPPVSTLIGLVRRFDGYYEPSNENCWNKVRALQKLSGLEFPLPFGIHKNDLAEWKVAARTHGYTIVTSIKAL